MTSGGFFGEPLKEAGREKGFTLGIGPGLPILGIDDPADVTLVFSDEVAETAQNAPLAKSDAILLDEVDPSISQ
ncbi:hypothetical protein VDGE_20592 [Verticillium dahliae]|uniref:Uncharacterized protein n=1 Tax=Verticillium dahliae TaxID=27337 RepID=A0A444S6R8_VERDA|nr:hypothetical protein VDGE_20592 [Verticillium dahliae]